MFFKKTISSVCLLLFCCISILAQDTTLKKTKQIGGFVAASEGWDGSSYALGNVWPLAYGISGEIEITKGFFFETGISHSIFIGSWICDSIDTDLSAHPELIGKSLINMQVCETSKREIVQHIRLPLIAKYYFIEKEKYKIGLFGGTIPGYFLDKASVIDRTNRGIVKYYQHYKRYGGFDIITLVTGIDYYRYFNKTTSFKTQLRAAIQNEAIAVGLLFGINHIFHEK